LAIQDVHTGLPGVAAGTARFLRILEDVPRRGVHAGGVVRTSGTSIYTAKRIVGSVPVEADGSAYFIVPANRNLYFEVLAGDSTEIQRMRSVVCLKPAEIRTCVGCHESRLAAPPNRRASALRRPPSRPVPPPWGDRAVSFLRDVQPLLNAHCSRCHTFDRAANQVLLTDDLTDRFTVAYEELLPYLTVANAMRWDHPDDVYPRPPYTYGSKVSPLSRLLAAGHQGVHLSEADWQRLVNWIDANGVYYDRYESAYGDERSIFGKAARTALSSPFERRCAGCHGKGDGQASTWWLSLNCRDVRRSRALMAPLARTAGGWGRCDGTVFASTADPDYQALLAAFTVVSEQLGVRPREDLLSIQGTDAERQDVTVPAPPPPRPANASSRLPEGWLPLGQLPWESAAAGWTPNRDGLPRQDTDIEGNALRLAARVYPHGIGTHAPSTITYQLRGGYDRFWAQVGAAESGGTVVFQVFGDDHCLFDSGLMRGLRGQKTADVAVAGVKALRLVVTDAGDGITADMANWVAPRLLPCPDSGQAPIPGRGP
jgi:mono/diheme cytochrome c family protein